MIQGDLGAGFLLDIGYVGNRGRQLPLLWEQNAALPGSGLAGLPFEALGRTASTPSLTAGLNSNYNSLQANLTKRFARSFSFTGAYTYGKALDYGNQLAIPFNRADNYGPADWDRTHVLAVSHLWRLPFGTGRRYAVGGAWGAIFGDWELNGIVRWATGTPYNVFGDPLLCACPGNNSVRLGATGGGVFNGLTSFDGSQFSIPPNQLSNVGRNSIRGPELFVYNAALFKNFAVTENFKLELRGEGYNVTNAANYANPISSALTAGFGSSNQLINEIAGRRFQVAARLLF